MTNEEKILAMLEKFQQNQAETNAEMKAEIGKLSQAVAKIEVDHGKKFDDLNQTVGDLNQTVDNLSQTVDNLNQTVDSLNQTVDNLGQTVTKIEVDHGKKLGAPYDAHLDTVRNATTIGALDARVEDHGHRIFALEQSR